MCTYFFKKKHLKYEAHNIYKLEEKYKPFKILIKETNMHATTTRTKARTSPDLMQNQILQKPNQYILLMEKLMKVK